MTLCNNFQRKWGVSVFSRGYGIHLGVMAASSKSHVFGGQDLLLCINLMTLCVDPVLILNALPVTQLHKGVNIVRVMSIPG